MTAVRGQNVRFDLMIEVHPAALYVGLRRCDPALIALPLRNTKEDAALRAVEPGQGLRPDYVGGDGGVGVRQGMVKLELAPEGSPVEDPHKLWVEGLAGPQLVVAQSRVLKLQD